MPTVQANGIDIYYEIHGEGTPVLIIGGLATDLTQLDGIVGRLSRNYRVVTFDNRGSGRTDKPDIPYTIEMMSDDTAGLIEALQLPSVDVIGVSMGGRIAMSLTLGHPILVKKLILASTTARTNYKRGLTWSLNNLLIRIPAVRRMGTRYPQPYYAYVHQRDASNGYDVTSRLREIGVPTLIIHGRNDRVAPFALAEEMHNAIAGSQIVAVSGGHAFFFGRPDEFTQIVTSFLDEPNPMVS